MIELILACALAVAPQTVAEIIRVESAGNPLAIHVNRLPASQQPKANTKEEAVSLARQYIEAGYSVDMGLMQINSGNLRKLDIELADLDALFTPCANITAGAMLLTESYQRAARQFGQGQKALQAALSAYNTGNFSDGLNNGYVARLYGHQIGGPYQVSATAAEAMRSPTGISWTPPEGYYPSQTPKQEGEHMEKNGNIPTKEELDAIDPTEVKAGFMGTVPGLGIEVEPDEADRMGAFEEDAMSLEDAIEASIDSTEAG